MAVMSEEAQWIILMGFIVSIAIIFLALIVNESEIVGKTTSESVLEFPKSDIQDIRHELLYLLEKGILDEDEIKEDIEQLVLARKNAVIRYRITNNILSIHYNNGITEYNEEIPITS